MKSLSEIETTSKRASRAVGFSWGVSEEIAKGVRLLELFGFSGIKNLNQYYKFINKKKFENLTIIKKNNKLNKSSLCPVNLGVRFLDQVKTLQSLKKITFYKIAYPILFLPFLSRGSEITGKKILLKFEKNTFLLNFNVNIFSNFSKKEFPSIAKKVEVSFMENKDTFSEKEWRDLYKLSENTFVEETESLKKGAAGAGLTDND
jgi:hypothetical protein|tara:strand:- start:27 stop:638 length:612 start_codon:yes stop_codon:yes gene_type:complete